LWSKTECSPIKVNRRFGNKDVASIFRVEEYARRETSVNQIASRALVGFSLGLFLYREGAGDFSLRNVD
jgi:hypothetical protein